jgi:D-aminopeptidase
MSQDHKGGRAKYPVMPMLPPPPPAHHAAPLRLRSGTFQTGRYDAITDVPGVLVNHLTIVRGANIRDGATVVMPTSDPWTAKAEAATFTINGNGAMTNSDWIAESAHLETPIVLVGNTLSVGAAYDGTVRAMMRVHPQIGGLDDVPLPVIAEVDGQRLNDARAMALTPTAVADMIAGAHGGNFARGSVGAGTPAVSFQYKGGIGSASSILPAALGGYTVGVLVNANTDRRDHLRIHGVPVGALLPHTDLPRNSQLAFRDRGRASDGSIIIVVATDAPLNARQLHALAKRTSFGLARAGSISRISSGDQVIAFSTSRVTHVNARGELVAPLAKLIENDDTLNELYLAAADATEDAIDDALLSAASMTSNGTSVFALPHKQLEQLLQHPPSALR